MCISDYMAHPDERLLRAPGVTAQSSPSPQTSPDYRRRSRYPEAPKHVQESKTASLPNTKLTEANE